MGSAVPASTAPPVPSQAVPPPGAYPEAEQGVHVHLVQCVHLQGQRERHRLSPTCAGVLWVPTPRHARPGPLTCSSSLAVELGTSWQGAASAVPSLQHRVALGHRGQLALSAIAIWSLLPVL